MSSSAAPRFCVVCGGSLNPPSGFTGIYSTVLADNGEQHYACWAGPTSAAVLAERERCAKIADADAVAAQEQIDRNNEYKTRTGSTDEGPNNLCRHRKHYAEQIARAIRAANGHG